MARIRINARTHTKEKPYLINLYFFKKLVRQKKSIGWAKYMYVCERDVCCRNFCNFSLVTKNVKSSSNIDPFSNKRHFEIWFPKKKTITFFWSKLSKLYKQDPIFARDVYVFPKREEKRKNSVPIPHPLTDFKVFSEFSKAFQRRGHWYVQNDPKMFSYFGQI